MKADIQEKPEGRKPMAERNPNSEVRRPLCQPGRAEDNSPAIYRWDSAPPNRVSPAGTKEVPRARQHDLFRPSGTGGNAEREYPAINRWAIFGRPCGTKVQSCRKMRNEPTSDGRSAPSLPSFPSVGPKNYQTNPTYGSQISDLRGKKRR